MQTVFKNKNSEILNLSSIKNDYFSYLKRNDIATKNNCSWQQIDKIIKILNWKRPFKSKYSLNESYFDVIDNEKKAYFLGLLMADGCVSDKNTVSISLKECDRHILDELIKELQTDSPLKFIKNNKKNQSNYYRVIFYSKKLCQSLIKLGCIPRKTHLLKCDISFMSEKLINHFVRGCFDGDGCISYRLYKNKYLKSTINFTSSKSFCEGLSILIKQKFEYNMYMSTRHKNSDTKTVELSGNIQNKNIINWLYKDSTVFLFRKREKAESFLKLYENKNANRIGKSNIESYINSYNKTL
jgi:hypothetical protein